MSSSIKNRFINIHALMLFIPIILMGVLITIFVWEEIEQRFHQEQTSTLNSIKTQVVDRHVHAMESALAAIAKDKELWRLFDEKTVKDKVRHDWRLVQDIFPKRAWIYYGDRKNRIFVIPEWVPPSDYDLRQRPWYTTAKKAGKLTWVQPYGEYITDEMVFTAAIPITNDEGEFTGVLAIDTFLQEFVKGMRTQALEETSELFIVTNEGTALSLSSKKRKDMRSRESYQWDKLFSRPGDSGYVRFNNTTYYGAYQELSPLPFRLVSLTPRSAIFSEILPLLSIIAVFTVIVLLVTGAGSMYIARYVIRNIQSLNDYMYDITQGKLSTRTCVSGDDEFLSMNSYMNTMVDTLARQIEQHRHTSNELSERNRQLDQLVKIDGLTRITNHRFFFETLRYEWDRMRREQRPISLLFIDIDFFKQYNDLYGHQSGDACLRQFASILEEVTRRPADMAARYGGEEFVVLLPNTPLDGAQEIGEMIQEKLERLGIIHEKSEVSQYLTCSIGIVSMVPDGNYSIDGFISAADIAAYKAKSQGRNRIAVSSTTK